MGRRLLALVMMLAVAGMALPVLTAPAAAQGFFERLFGGPRVPMRPGGNFGRPPLVPPGQIGNRPMPAPQVIGEPQAPLKPVKPKNEDARKVVVIGDFLGGALAAGLDQIFAEDQTVVVLDKTMPSSGLVRKDHYDWDAKLIELLNTEHPATVVVLVGANDRQQFRLDSGRLQLRSPEWEALYRERIKRLAETLRAYGQPFFWVGVPPLKDRDASTDVATFNNFYKAGVEAAGGTFVDVWNGFVDADGRYVRRGPDVEGQVVNLRAADGINFNRAGRNKLAYYVEREMRRTGVLGGEGAGLLASTTVGDRMEIGPNGERIWVGPVLSLSAPAVGAAMELAGGPPRPAPTPVATVDPVIAGLQEETPPAPTTPAATVDADSLRYKLVVAGESVPAVAGRVDDFAWPPKRLEAVAVDVQPPAPPPSVAVIVDGVPIPPRKPAAPAPQAAAQPVATPAGIPGLVAGSQ